MLNPENLDHEMTIFDQRGQRVTYQYNAAGNIDLAQVRERDQLIGELEKLRAEIRIAFDSGSLDQETTTDAEYQLTKAVQLAQKPDGEKRKILQYLEATTDLIREVTAVGGLVTALTQATALVQKLF